VAPPEKVIGKTTYPLELFEQASESAAVDCCCQLAVTGLDRRYALGVFIYSAAEYSKAAQTPKELRRFPPYCGLMDGREDRAMTRAIKMEPIREPAHSPATPRSVEYEVAQPKNRCH
jgi:hypothetical protein